MIGPFGETNFKEEKEQKRYCTTTTSWPLNGITLLLFLIKHSIVLTFLYHCQQGPLEFFGNQMGAYQLHYNTILNASMQPSIDNTIPMPPHTQQLLAGFQPYDTTVVEAVHSFKFTIFLNFIETELCYFVHRVIRHTTCPPIYSSRTLLSQHLS